MNRFIKLSALAAAAIMAAPSFAAATVDANAEFDTGYSNKKNAGGTFQGGRIEINVAGKQELNGGFVAGRGTVLATDSGTAGIDDAWVQAGTSAFDVKTGRFEAADLYPTPGDVFRFPAAISTTNLLRGRATYAGASGNNDRLHLALTANLAPGTSLEVGVIDTKDVANATVNGKGGAKGIRPSIAFSAGIINARLGLETGKLADTVGTQTAKFTTFGGWVSASINGGLTLRANVSSGKVQPFAGADIKKSGLLLGADIGALNVNFESGKTGDAKSSGVFAAYAIPLFGIKGATFQPALGSYKETAALTGVKTTETRVGARVHYDF